MGQGTAGKEQETAGDGSGMNPDVSPVPPSGASGQLLKNNSF